MDVEAMLDRFEELRDGSGGHTDVLVGLLGWLEHREHLDRLIDGLPGSEAVADRTEQFLLQREPVSRTGDELLGFATAHIAELVGAAARDAEPETPMATMFAGLADFPVTLSENEPTATGAEIVGGAFTDAPCEDTAGTLLTTQEVAAIVEQDAEWAHKRVRFPASWELPQIAFLAAVADRPGVGAWLLAPAVTTEFDFEPFYRIWEAGASLWLTTEGFAVVRSDHLRWKTSSYSSREPSGVALASDAEWLQTNNKHGRRVLDLITTSRSRGGTRVEFDGLEMTSFPPSLFESADWEYITVTNTPGFAGWEAAFDLPEIKGIRVERSGLTSTPSRWADTLQGVSLDRNRLTSWPENLDQASSQLTTLSISHNELTELPDDIGALKDLKTLNVDHNSIGTVSPTIENLQKLDQLFLGWNPELTSLPREILDLPGDCRINLKKTGLPQPLMNSRTIEALRSTWPGPGWS